MSRHLHLLAVLAIAALTAACASTPPPAVPGAPPVATSANDPLEKFNRASFALNTKIDKYLLRPTTEVYRTVPPSKFRVGVYHVLRNLGEPFTAINDLLQAKPKKAAQAIWRFAVNSTVGIGGILDVAKKADVPYHREDLGQTLAVWGVPSGPYLMLPVFGPTTVRDFAGYGAGGFLDPAILVTRHYGGDGAGVSLFVANGVSVRDRQFELIDDLLARPDAYVAARTSWLQHREFQISDGALVPSAEEEELFGTEPAQPEN